MRYPKYLIGAVRDRMLRAGLKLVDNREAAEIVVELRSGGQSIDHKTLLIGIPSFPVPVPLAGTVDRKSTRLNSSHQIISYAVFCLKKKKRIMKFLLITENTLS